MRIREKTLSLDVFNAYLTKRSQLSQLGFAKGSLWLDKSAYSLELKSGESHCALDIFDLRKYLISQATRSVKKPIPKDFLFEVSLLTAAKERVDLLVLDRKSFKKVTEGLTALLNLKDVLREFHG